MNNVIVYTKQTCPFCISAKKQLNDMLISFDEKDADQTDVFDELRVRMNNANRITVPQIYIQQEDGDYHVGGYTDMMKLIEMNLFDDLLNP
jgi:glutaredoxin 3